MDRRTVLKGIAALPFAGLPAPEALARQHPFTGLMNVNTASRYIPNPHKFSMVLFMTAAQNYPSCGDTFLGVTSLISTLNARNDIEPIIVMPHTSVQNNPNDKRNAARATNTYPDNIRFTILTADLATLQQAAHAVGTSFSTNRGGKVDGHSLDAFFLSPNGDLLYSSRAANLPYDNVELTQRLIDRHIAHNVPSWER